MNPNMEVFLGQDLNKLHLEIWSIFARVHQAKVKHNDLLLTIVNIYDKPFLSSNISIRESFQQLFLLQLDDYLLVFPSFFHV